ncbi:MAG: hypothetical protein HKP58_15680 [Desulfatitalea sp.]|nr:hypothetical protein [Desulfatitalea sp.]NNK01851.1 hypothetical protein [Desulfatitalea sp.]
MEYGQVAKRMLNMQKSSFDHWFNTVSLVQNQAESTVDMVLNQAAWLPENGRNAIQSWMSVCQKERGRFKTYMDNGFVAFEKAFTEAVKPAEKPKKASPPSQG